MTTVIPAGWKYAGPDYNGRSNSYETEDEAEKESVLLRSMFHKDFTSIPYESRWIIITKKESYERKKSSKSKPIKRKCKCKK